MHGVMKRGEADSPFSPRFIITASVLHQYSLQKVVVVGARFVDRDEGQWNPSSSTPILHVCKAQESGSIELQRVAPES